MLVFTLDMVQVGRRELLPEGTLAEVKVSGRRVLLCNSAGEIFALAGACPHLGAPLAHGALHVHTIVCPWHGWEFDCRTGEGDQGCLETYSVEVRDGIIYVNA